LTFKLTRATIHLRSVQVAMMLDDKVGYIQLSPVSETSAAELSEAVGNLVQKGMKSLVLDLRSNPGGLLDQGVAVSELFLDTGDGTEAYDGALVHADRHLHSAQEQERSRSGGAGRRGGAGSRFDAKRFGTGVPHRPRPHGDGWRRNPAGSIRQPGHVHDRGAK